MKKIFNILLLLAIVALTANIVEKSLWKTKSEEISQKTDSEKDSNQQEDTDEEDSEIEQKIEFNWISNHIHTSELLEFSSENTNTCFTYQEATQHISPQPLFSPPERA